MPSVSVAVVEVPAPIEEAHGFLANLENAAAWWPLVVGSVNQPVRALPRRAGVRQLRKPRCDGAAAPTAHLLARSQPRSLADWLLSPQFRHASRYLPDLPIKVGSCYRLLLSPPLAEVLHLCVVEWRPLAHAEWRGSSAARHMRLELSLQRSPDAPQAVTRIELRWSYEWRGWRRLKGAVPAAHVAARAVGEQAAARIAAAFAQGLHLAYRPAEAPVVASPTTLAGAIPVSVTTVLPTVPELAVPLEDIHA